MGSVTPYENDVFISYAHIDDTPLTEGQAGWVSEFHRSLEVLIKQILGAEPSIWRDPKLHGNDYFGDTLVNALPKTAVLVTILSPRYLNSEWCLKELETFSSSAMLANCISIENKSRIFKVVKTLVPHEGQPMPLDRLLGYEFFSVDPDTGKPREYRIEFGPEAQQRYLTKLYDLAYEIAEFLKLLSQPTCDQPHALPKEPIFLAETSSDLNDERDRVKSELRQLGYTVLPDQQLPFDAPGLRNAVQTDLERSSLSIHLIGENTGFTPEGDQRSIVRLQNDIAAEHSRGRGLPRLIWMPSDITPQSERQQKFITHLERDPDEQLGADILRTNLEELKTIVIDKLQSKKNPSSDSRGADDLTNIYLVCDQCDYDDTVQLSDYLFEQGFEVLLPVFEGDESEVREDHTDKLKYCDAIIIYQGAAKDLWLSSKLRDLRKLPGYDGYQPKLAKAIYAGPPANPQKERLRTREAMVLREFQSFSAQSLEPFIAEIESGRQESQP